MTRDEWYAHLVTGTGPLSPDAVEHVAPDETLLALLRELIELPWPEHDDPERELENDIPFFAMLLLGLLRDEASIPQLIAVLGHAVEHDWDAVAEIGPPTIGAIGPSALPHVLAEIERIEREENIDAIEIEKKGLDESKVYRYWALVIALEQITLNHPEVRADVARFAEARLRSTRFDGRRATKPRRAPIEEDDELVSELPTPTEIWVDLQLSLRLPELDDAIDAFFARMGAGYASAIFGSRSEFDALIASDAPEGDAVARIVAVYRALHQSDVDDDDDDEHDGLDDDADWDDEDDGERIEPYVRPEPKVGRNDPCPCGSGRKYKKCHGAAA